MKYLLIILFSINLFATSKIEKKSLLDSIEKLDFKIFKIEKKLRVIKKKIDTNQELIKNNEIKLGEIEEEKAIIKKKLVKRLKFLFKTTNRDTLSFFSDSKNVLEIEQKEKFIKKITSQDYELLKKHHEIIKKEKEIIIKNRDSLLLLEKEEKNLKKEKIALKSQRKNKRKKLNKILSSKELKRRLAKEKEIAAAKISKKHKIISRKSKFTSLKGKLRLPVKAKVSKWYFVKKRRRSFTVHKGLTFKIPIGTQVHSIYKGEIVFTGYIKGFGKTLIIAHGQSYYSIYMHLNQIIKKRGDKVDINELVALSGESGSAEIPKLYFEIRHKKNPININRWFVTRK